MVVPIIVIGALFTLAACGGGVPTGTSSSPTLTATAAPAVSTPAAVVPTAAVAPTVVPQPTVSSAPATAAPQPTATTAAAPTATPVPAATPTPEPTVALPATFSEYGFQLVFKRGAAIQVLGTASPERGAITFAYGELNVVVTWLPQGSSLLALVSGIYDIIQSNQPDLAFDTLADGEVLVDGESGVFLGFKAEDTSGDASGGLIGSWDCRTSGTAFTLTLTGANSALVQVRFDELLDNFACAVS